MSSRQFVRSSLSITVYSDDPAQLEPHDVYGNGDRLSFDDGQVIIDWQLRTVLEIGAPSIEYDIREARKQLLSARGTGKNRRLQGGQPVQGQNPPDVRVHVF